MDLATNREEKNEWKMPGVGVGNQFEIQGQRNSSGYYLSTFGTAGVASFSKAAKGQKRTFPLLPASSIKYRGKGQ